MQFFRLLHRQTKSEGDVSTLLHLQVPPGVAAPVFLHFPNSLPSFDPTNELYVSHAVSSRYPRDTCSADQLNARIIELEEQLFRLQEERSILEQDLVDYRADLLHARNALYSDMVRSARKQQQAMEDFRTIQKLQAGHQRFCTLLVDIGIPHLTVDAICQAIQSADESPQDMLVDAIKQASAQSSTLLARLQPIPVEVRTPERYQSALNLTLSIRKELKSQKKRSKFWKKLAQEEDRHASTITPSPSDISSIRDGLSPERQSAVDALIARRRAARHSENTENDVFGGGQRRESALDTLASRLASRPRRSVQEDLRRSSSFSSSTSSTSTTYFSYLSGFSRISRGATAETPTISSRAPSILSTSLRRSSRGPSQSTVLGNVNLNVSRSSSVDPTLPEEPELHMNPDAASVFTITRSQDLLQNDRQPSAEIGHGRLSSTSLRRSAPAHSTRSSFRFSAFSPSQRSYLAESLAGTGPDTKGEITQEISSFNTPDIFHLSDLTPSTNFDSDTPASSGAAGSEDTPFNDTRVLPKYVIDTPFSITDLAPRVVSTPLNGSLNDERLSGNVCSHDTPFLEHLESSVSMTMSVSVSASAFEASNDQDGHEHEQEDLHEQADTSTSIMPLGESNDSLFTTSASASASSSLTANETPAPVTPPTPSPSLASTPPTGKASTGRSMLPVLAKHLRRLSLSGPSTERLVDKLRGLRSLSRSRSSSSSGPGSPLANAWRGSPARSESSRSGHLTPSPSPAKGSGIPVLQRRMTIRARKMSMRRG